MMLLRSRSTWRTNVHSSAEILPSQYILVITNMSLAPDDTCLNAAAVAVAVDDDADAADDAAYNAAAISADTR